MPITVQELLADKVKPVCVAHDAMAIDALRLMMASDFSQLPVIDDKEELVGMVTSDSIIRALNHLGLKVEDLRITNAIQKPRPYKIDSDLSDLLEGLRDAYAVPVVDNLNQVIGIVTNYDTAAYFRGRSEDMILVEDIETMIKDCVRVDLIAAQGQLDDTELLVAVGDSTKDTEFKRNFGTVISQALELVSFQPSDDQKKSIQRLIGQQVSPSSEPKPFDRLSLNEYLALFLHQTRWEKYCSHIDLPKEACRKMLEDVRDIRNDLFHFRTDISAERRGGLRFCRDWLDRNQQKIMDAMYPSQKDEIKPATFETLADEKGTTREVITSQIKDVLEETPQLIEKITSDTSKYEELATFLQTLPSHVDNVMIAFEEFETIIESELPKSAYEHRSWWANDSVGHVQSRQWLEVGWRVSSVNISQQRVTFTRIKDREQKYIAFFSGLLNKIRAKDLELKDVSPTGRSFIQFNGIRSENNERIAFVGCSFARKNRFRVEFYIDTGDHFKNQFVFDSLQEFRHEIEEAIDWKLDWETLDERRAVRIAAYHFGSITDTDVVLNGLGDWAAEYIARFDHLFIHRMADKIVEFEFRANSFPKPDNKSQPPS